MSCPFLSCTDPHTRSRPPPILPLGSCLADPSTWILPCRSFHLDPALPILPLGSCLADPSPSKRLNDVPRGVAGCTLQSKAAGLDDTPGKACDGVESKNESCTSLSSPARVWHALCFWLAFVVATRYCPGRLVLAAAVRPPCASRHHFSFRLFFSRWTQRSCSAHRSTVKLSGSGYPGVCTHIGATCLCVYTTCWQYTENAMYFF